MNPTSYPPPRDRWQFSLAWLVFWTLVCACGMAVARQLLLRGDQGAGLLILFGFFALWFAMFCLATYRHMFHRRRWEKARQQREELRQWVDERRERHKQLP